MLPPSPDRNFIVYVDDDEDDLDFVSTSLSRYKATLDVLLFEGGKAGYRFLLELEKTRQKPCLIILDINMPVMSGKELLLIIRSIPFFDDTPIILFSTSNAESDYAFAKKYKAGFITKPIGYAQMEVIAEEFLSHCVDEVREKIKG